MKTISYILAALMLLMLGMAVAHADYRYKAPVGGALYEDQFADQSIKAPPAGQHHPDWERMRQDRILANRQAQIDQLAQMVREVQDIAPCPLSKVNGKENPRCEQYYRIKKRTQQLVMDAADHIVNQRPSGGSDVILIAPYPGFHPDVPMWRQ